MSHAILAKALATHAAPIEVMHWIRDTPVLTGSADTDLAALTIHSADADALLKAFPSKGVRGDAEQSVVDAIHATRRRLRAAFLGMHALWIYDALTERRSQRMRLDELVAVATKLFPGLLPSHADMAGERTQRLAYKEGLEIDQGIFLACILDSREAGTHLLDTMLLPTARARSLLENFQHQGELDLGSVRICRDEHEVAHVTLANLDSLNAEDSRLVDDLETAVDLALLDPGVKVGVMRGAPMSHPRYRDKRVFSAGINLKEFHAGRIPLVDFLLRRELGFINKLRRGLLRDDAAPTVLREVLEKPWIAAVDTFAIGGGAQLLHAFDHVIASAGSFVSLPAAQEGIVPGMANLRLVRDAGARLARQIILDGRKLWTHEPEIRWVVDAVVEPQAMDEAIADSARRLAMPAVIPNRSLINLFEETSENLRSYAARFAFAQAQRLYATDVTQKVWRS